MSNEKQSFKSHPLDEYINGQTSHSPNKENNSQIQKLTPEETRRIEEICETIKPLDNESLLAFGANLQQKMSQFSHHMLDEVKSKDVGPVGDTLNQLMSKLKAVNPDDLSPEKQSKLKRLFRRTKASINEMFSRMQSVSSQIDRITIQLNQHKDHLSRDIALLDELYELNKNYFDDISLYILAAQQKKEAIQTETLPRMREHTQQNNNQMAIQDIADMEQFVDRLDKRIYDLQLSRQIALQTAPQIRMIQNVNQALAEKIQSSILTSIPLWKNQMAIALTLLRQRHAVRSQRAVTDTTNDLLTQNALETATENERGIVDVDTLKATQSDIIQTIEQTLEIQQQGRQKRQQAEKELNQLETELKTHLNNMRHNK